MIQDFRNASGRRNEHLKAQKEAKDTATSAKKRAPQEIEDLKIKKQNLIEEKFLELESVEIQLNSLHKKIYSSILIINELIGTSSIIYSQRLNIL